MGGALRPVPNLLGYTDRRAKRGGPSRGNAQDRNQEAAAKEEDDDAQGHRYSLHARPAAAAQVLEDECRLRTGISAGGHRPSLLTRLGAPYPGWLSPTDQSF